VTAGAEPGPTTRSAQHEALPPERLARWSRYGRWDQTFFPSLVGIVVEDIRVDYCRMRLPWRPELAQPAGLLHGGAIATLVDSVMVPAIGAAYDAPQGFATVDLHVQYQGGVNGEDIVAEGWVTQRGRSMVFAEAEVLTAAGAPVAKAMLTFRLLGGR
jgi:uncharacterized protein (TIGR00369 family)